MKKALEQLRSRANSFWDIALGYTHRCGQYLTAECCIMVYFGILGYCKTPGTQLGMYYRRSLQISSYLFNLTAAVCRQAQERDAVFLEDAVL